MHNGRRRGRYQEGGARVTWQDELRRLDEEMTAGRLSSDDYQRRRDELMAEQAEGGAQAQQSPGQGSPFPPAFRWEADPPADSTASTENTQVFGQVGGGDDESSEQTQVVPKPERQPEQQQGPSFEDSERTQVVQAGLPPAPPSYAQPQFPPSGSLFTPSQNSAPPWGQQDSAPPWASSDLPPIQEPNAAWMMQGPEFFEKEETPGNTGWILAVAGAVVVLLLIGVGAFFLFRPSGTPTAEPTPTPQTTAATPAPPAPPPPAAPVGPPMADLPGARLDTSALKDFSRVNELGYLTDSELRTLAQAGPSEARYGLSDDGPNRLIILIVKAQNAGAARDQLANLQVQFNLTEEDGPPGVRVAGNDDVPNGAPVLRRAHYVSGDYLVRVQVSGNSVQGVESRFDRLLGDQLGKLPANG
jgi:hypothetical protein